MRGRKESGLATLQRSVDIMREFERLRRMGFGFIENPKDQMRYVDEISHLPLTNISQASYSDPGQRNTWDLHPDRNTSIRADICNQSQISIERKPLPPFKSTDLFGNLPPNMFIRPQMPRTLADKLYAKGERGSQKRTSRNERTTCRCIVPRFPPNQRVSHKIKPPCLSGR